MEQVPQARGFASSPFGRVCLFAFIIIKNDSYGSYCYPLKLTIQQIPSPVNIIREINSKKYICFVKLLLIFKYLRQKTAISLIQALQANNGGIFYRGF